MQKVVNNLPEKYQQGAFLKKATNYELTYEVKIFEEVNKFTDIPRKYLGNINAEELQSQAEFNVTNVFKFQHTSEIETKKNITTTDDEKSAVDELEYIICNDYKTNKLSSAFDWLHK